MKNVLKLGYFKSGIVVIIEYTIHFAIVGSEQVTPGHLLT